MAMAMAPTASDESGEMKLAVASSERVSWKLVVVMILLLMLWRCGDEVKPWYDPAKSPSIIVASCCAGGGCR